MDVNQSLNIAFALKKKKIVCMFQKFVVYKSLH